jgi:putative nucleotidyltransferase with HDIG domain
MSLDSRLPADLRCEYPELAGLLEFASRRVPEVLQHCMRVANLARPLGEAMRLNESDSKLLVLSAYLHDVGKLFVPPSLLFKPGRYEGWECAAMRQHPTLGASLLCSYNMGRIATIVGQHHEWFDGNGYPLGADGEMVGTKINVLARAISVVDAYIAMIEARPYQQQLSPEGARREIKRFSGSQFDPEIAGLFLRLDLTADLTAELAAC